MSKLPIVLMKLIIPEGRTMPIQVQWEELESKEVRERILKLADKKLVKLFEQSGLHFTDGTSGEALAFEKVVDEVREKGIDSGRLIVLIEEGFLDGNIDGQKIILAIEELEK
jgi:hypothetical protein